MLKITIGLKAPALFQNESESGGFPRRQLDPTGSHSSDIRPRHAVVATSGESVSQGDKSMLRNPKIKVGTRRLLSDLCSFHLSFVPVVGGVGS
jgi:hypothetical protein